MKTGTLAALIIASAVGQIDAKSRPAQFGDFAAYWTAGIAFREKLNPYEWPAVKEIEKREDLSQSFPIRNPPWILPLLVPFSLLPFKAGAIAFCAVNIILLMRMALVSGRWFGVPAFWGMVLAILFVPADDCLGISQWSIIVAAGAVGYFEELRRDRPLRAGMWLVLCTLKPHIVGLLWIYALFAGTLKQKAKAFAGLIAGIGLLTAVALVVWPDAFVSWRESFASPSRQAATDFLAPTLGMWIRTTVGLTAPVWIQFVPAGPAAVVYLAVLLSRRYSWDDPELFAATLLFGALAMPYGWNFDYSLLLPAYLAAWSTAAGWSTASIRSAQSPELSQTGSAASEGLSTRQKILVGGLLLFEVVEMAMITLHAPKRLYLFPILLLSVAWGLHVVSRACRPATSP